MTSTPTFTEPVYRDIGAMDAATRLAAVLGPDVADGKVPAQFITMGTQHWLGGRIVEVIHYDEVIKHLVIELLNEPGIRVPIVWSSIQYAIPLPDQM